MAIESKRKKTNKTDAITDPSIMHMCVCQRDDTRNETAHYSCVYLFLRLNLEIIEVKLERNEIDRCPQFDESMMSRQAACQRSNGFTQGT
jgi:hypothetical protein